MYFSYAVAENLKFGDELPMRWRAIASITNRTIEEFNNEDELSYRLLRVAEFVGEHIVREKYWSRNEAVYLATLLSPAQGLAGISRWRERNIGWIENQFTSVLKGLMERNYLEPVYIWGLSGFLNNREEDLVNLFEYCLVKELDDNVKCQIVKQIDLIASVKGYSEVSCERILRLMRTNSLDDLKMYFGRKQGEELNPTYSSYEKLEAHDISSLLDDWEYTDIDSLSEVFKILHCTDGLSTYNNDFWRLVFERVGVRYYSDFLENLLEIPNVDFWSIGWATLN